MSVAELYKMKDTIEIHEQGGAGRMIHLAPALRKPVMDGDQEDSEVSNSIRVQFHNQGVLNFSCKEIYTTNSNFRDRNIDDKLKF